VTILPILQLRLSWLWETKKQVIPSLGNGGRSRWLCEAKERNLTIKVMLKVNKAKEQFIPTPIPSSNLTS
jgi:hypothetical protein